MLHTVLVSPRRVMMVTESRRRAFTLTELLIVLGLVALLVALLLPVVGRMRSTAAAVGCMSSLRQVCTAWTMAMSEDRGRLIDYVNSAPRPDEAWKGYWTGAAEQSRLSPAVLLCPSALGPTGADDNEGYGDADHAWTGRYATAGTALKYNDNTYRVSSYGFNRYLTSSGGFGSGGATYLTDVRNASNVPAFLDCASHDVRPANGSVARPVEPPPDLHGTGVTRRNPEHWRFLLARHGRGINVCMADGSARWVRLEDLYTLNWKADWAPYQLTLPAH
jgi:prepilin-type N-terminal cleavage/methylation domain-containing protein/prepilin-type processing-associated H-X9-DG protein